MKTNQGRKYLFCLLVLVVAFFLHAHAFAQTAAPGMISKVPTGEYGAYDGAWSADGSSAIFISDKGGDPAVYKVPAPSGGNVTTITLVSDNRADLWPDVSRRTNEVVFCSNRTSPNAQVCITEPGKSGITQVTSCKLGAAYPSWSPDGKEIAFSSPDINGTWQICIINRDGSNLRQLSAGVQPRWSPDGKRLVYASLSALGKESNWDIYSIGKDGTGITQITAEKTNDFEPDWSADGDWICYVSVREKLSFGNRLALTSRDRVGLIPWYGKKQTFSLWMKNVGGINATNAVQLTDSPNVHVHPRWSPAGNRLLFSSNRGGVMDLYTMDVSIPTSRKPEPIPPAPLPEASPVESVMPPASVLPVVTMGPKYIETNGSAFIPLKSISEWMGASVDFNRQSGIITLESGTNIISLKLQSTIASVNGKLVQMSSPAITRDGNAYVPVRFISDALSARVKHNEATGEISIENPSGSAVLVLSK